MHSPKCIHEKYIGKHHCITKVSTNKVKSHHPCWNLTSSGDGHDLDHNVPQIYLWLSIGNSSNLTSKGEPFFYVIDWN